MLKKIALTLLLLCVTLPSYANFLDLQFSVDFYQKNVVVNGVSTMTNPNIVFTYDVIVDTSNPSLNNSANFDQAYFSLVNLPISPVTTDIQSNMSMPISISSLSHIASVSSEFRANGVIGSGGPQTYNSLGFFGLIGSQTTSEYISYQRGIAISETLYGNFLQNFATIALDDYLKTFIGNSTFQFQDGYTYQLKDSNVATYQYYYWGNATLLSVTSVPIPSSAWIFLTGVLGLIGFKRRHP